MSNAPELVIRRATKEKRKLRLCLVGYENTGKTYSALEIGRHLVPDRPARILLADSEGGSASIYADRFDFDHLEMPDHAPETYVRVVDAAEVGGYDVLVFDSLSHEWMGSMGGVLARVDSLKAAGGYGWDKASPIHQAVFERIIRSRLHVIATLRQKKAYVEDRDARGRTRMRVQGTEPVQREGSEYEFDVILALDAEHVGTVIKSRLQTVTAGGRPHPMPGRDLALLVLADLNAGVEPGGRRERRVGDAVLHDFGVAAGAVTGAARAAVYAHLRELGFVGDTDGDVWKHFVRTGGDVAPDVLARLRDTIAEAAAPGAPTPTPTPPAAPAPADAPTPKERKEAKT